MLVNKLEAFVVQVSQQTRKEITALSFGEGKNETFQMSVVLLNTIHTFTF